MAQEQEFCLLLTIDTEEDWPSPGEPPTFHNIYRLERFQDFCDQLGLRPTYLVAYEVLEDDKGREVIRQLAQTRRCEVGAHLHAWLTPPWWEPLDGSQALPYLHEYPEEIRAAKLETMTKAIQEATGQRPLSYRGGRWSMDCFTMQWLDQAGFAADTTVTPFVSWVLHRGYAARGINFIGAPTSAYHPRRSDFLRPGSLQIWEVPTSHRLRR